MKIRSTNFAGKTVIISQQINNGKLSFDAEGLSTEIETEDRDYVAQLASVLNGEIVDTNFKKIELAPEPETVSEIPEVIPVFRHSTAKHAPNPPKRGHKRK